MLGSVPHEATPAATDVEHAHSRLKLKLATNQVKLRFLCFCQIARVFPVATGIRHSRVKHCRVKVVAEVVMHFTDLPRSPQILPVEQARTQGVKHQAPRLYLLIQMRL